MIESDKDLVFSEAVKAGKRIYYFDVKQSRNGDRYIAITESKKVNHGTEENPQLTFEKHKLFLYREDYQKFTDALDKAINIASEVPSPYESNVAKHDMTHVEPKVENAVAEQPSAEPVTDETATALDDLLKF
ncbi:MAG: DUF3276 family protein [Prevotellaceae bacterium]|nr:DUF3276 family protein [Candidatus Colivivens equi]MCQ2075525.1 PUR family DNA/RNA-binding protein [Bacteroidaceae bacterium]